MTCSVVKFIAKLCVVIIPADPRLLDTGRRGYDKDTLLPDEVTVLSDKDVPARTISFPIWQGLPSHPSFPMRQGHILSGYTKGGEKMAISEPLAPRDPVLGYEAVSRYR